MWQCRIVMMIIYLGMVTTVTIHYMRVQNDVLPVKGQQIVLVCSISDFTGNVHLYKTDKPLTNADDKLCYCNSQGECSPYDQRYKISSNTSGIYITLPSLDRVQDQKYWTCSYGQSIDSVQLLIYTPPQRIQYLEKPSVQTDLSMTPLTLKASTDCIYLKETVTFTWYTNEPGGNWQVYPVKGVTSNTSSECSDPFEKIYASTLTLAGNTTFTNNVDIAVQFQCGIDNYTNLYTDLSERVVFAVKVSSVTLWNGNTIVTNNSMVTVAHGMFSSLNCTPSSSRPNATVVLWYVGQTEVQRGIVLVFTLPFNDSYHNKSIYCRAFNIRETEAVESNRLMLYVTVNVSSAELRESINTSSSGSNITVTNGVSKTLYCVLGINRPTATVRWYIGNVQQQLSDTKYDFQFTPNDTYHSKQIYCTAFNLQPESQAVASYKPYLYVQVYADKPTLSTGDLALLAGDVVSLVCNSSLTRPSAKIAWQGITSSNITSVINHADRDFVWTTSTITFVPTQNNNNDTVYCDASIDGQVTPATSQQTLEVWWPPLKPYTTESPTFPWIEDTTDRSLTCTTTGDGNPKATSLSWSGRVGTQDPNNASRWVINTVTYEHDGANITCQLNNGYTKRKGQPVLSDVKTLNINFSPKVLLLDQHRFVGTSGAMFNDYVPIFCKPMDIGGIIHIRRPDNKINRLNVTLVSSSVTVHIQGASVQRDGYSAYVYMNNVTDEDYGTYVWNISNSIGSLEWHFILQAESVPSPVKVVKYLGITNEVPTFYMKSGFNGGYEQQFIVETSEDGNVWTERLRFNESDSRFLKPNGTYIFGINGLEPGSYKVRVVSNNALGTAEQFEQSYIEFTIVKKANDIPTGAIVGGIIAVIAVILVIAIVLYKKRAGKIHNCLQKRKHGKTYKKQKEDTYDYANVDFSTPDTTKEIAKEAAQDKSRKPGYDLTYSMDIL